MSGLRIAPDLVLPDEAVTETFVVLAKRGKGKTYLASVMAEELITAGLPVVVIDPVGVWWGLRSSADGAGEGLPVVMFGGDHADVPLEAAAGQLVADVVIDERIPAVIDLSLLSKTKAKSFVADFLERLYHRNRDPLHVIVDEADMFAPLRAKGDIARCLGAMEDVVRRGRGRALGATLVTQRPAVLHNDVRTQAEVLIAMGMTGVRDVAAIDEWVRLHADEDQAVELKRSLPSLPQGTAWVWSPSWLSILQRVKIRQRTTFDSSATPKPGQKRRTPKRMAAVDLDALGEKITATVERAKADDPKELRRRITELERNLAAERARTPEPVVERVEVPVIDRDWREAFSETVDHLLEQLHSVDRKMQEYPNELPTEGKQGQPTTRSSAPRATQASSTTGRAPVAGPSTTKMQDPAASRETRPAPAAGTFDPPAVLPRAQKALLRTLCQHGTLTAVQLSVLSGYSIKSSAFKNALGVLRTAEYAVGGRDAISATDTGAEILGDVPPLPAGQDLVRHWMTNLSKAEKALLAALLDVWPDPLTAEELSARSGYSVTSSAFKNALGRLRTIQLAHGDRYAIRASDELGEAA